VDKLLAGEFTHRENGAKYLLAMNKGLSGNNISVTITLQSPKDVYKVSRSTGLHELIAPQAASFVASLPPGRAELYRVGDNVAPAAVTDLYPSVVFDTRITVSWTAPGDDGNVGTASTYDLRSATFPITAQNFNSATPTNPQPVPQISGTMQNYEFTGLECTPYYFAIKARDEALNWSPVSNVASAETYCPCPGCMPPKAGAEAFPTAAALTTVSPNPARDKVAYDIAVPVNQQGSAYSLDVYNVSGRRVRSLARGAVLAGRHSVAWDLRDDAGRAVPNGLYYARLKVADRMLMHRVVVLR
jgi:hypothetical protein